MEIHPAINCDTRDCFVKRLEKARAFLSEEEWVHIDVSDGVATSTNSYTDEEVLQSITGLRYEAHLMIDSQHYQDERWFSGAYHRLLFDAHKIADWSSLTKKAKENGIEIGAVVDVGDGDKIMLSEDITLIEILSVHPGPSGQTFDARALSTISAFKKQYKHAILLVDGGVDPRVGTLAKQAGADVLISGSYIWDSKNPEKAYQELKHI